MKRFISLFSLAFIVNIISWLFIYFKIRPGSEIIPLHYNIFYGADSVGRGYYIYFLPAVGMLILLVNFILQKYAAKVDGKTDDFAGKTLAAVSLASAVIIFIAVAFLKSLILI